MVDQLWMWVLDEHTILTCYPRRYGVNKPDPSGVHKSIRLRLKAMTRNQLRSAYDLALVILDECSNTFFDRTKARDSQPRLADIFSESIGIITNKQTNLFKHLWHWAGKASRIYHSPAGTVSTSNLHTPLLDIDPEGRLQREIKDIIDELDMMIHINLQQNEVMKRFTKLARQIIDPTAAYYDTYRLVENERGPEPSRETIRNPGRSSNDSTTIFEPLRHTPSWASTTVPSRPSFPQQNATNRREQYEYFSARGSDLLADAKDRIDELWSLRRSAETTADNIKELLALKQQQASVVQAYESMKQAEETVKQGRAIMMFTVVTIIFLPLSFMSSVFGMNAAEFDKDNTMSLGAQFRIMFPLSGAVIIVTLIMAFSNFARSLLWSIMTYCATWLIVTTPLYNVWLAWGHNSGSIASVAAAEVKKLKDSVQRSRRNAKLLARNEQRTAEVQPSVNRQEDQLATSQVLSSLLRQRRMMKSTPKPKGQGQTASKNSFYDRTSPTHGLKWISLRTLLSGGPREDQTSGSTTEAGGDDEIVSGNGAINRRESDLENGSATNMASPAIRFANV